MKHTHYRIGVLTNVTGQSLNDLKATADAHNVTFDQIVFPTTPLEGLRESELIQQMSSYDIIYYRTGMRGAIIDEVSQILDKKGIPHVNGVTKHSYLHQKIRQALIADRYNIPQPKSFSATNFNYDNIAKVLGSTFVIKPDDGSKGTDVALIHSKADLTKFRESKTKDQYFYQEFVEDAAEYRVYTVGSKGIATYKKIQGDGDFRANMHVGGSITQTEPSIEKELLAFGGHIAKCFDVDISGVDILVKDGKMLFLELNLQPGWEQLDEMTGTDFCKETIAHILRRAHKSKTIFSRLTQHFK